MSIKTAGEMKAGPRFLNDDARTDEMDYEYCSLGDGFRAHGGPFYAIEGTGITKSPSYGGCEPP